MANLQALGMIETKGLVGSIEAADAMARELSASQEVHLRTDAIVTPAAKDVFAERGVLVLRDQ